jgi:hypothetical protein
MSDNTLNLIQSIANGDAIETEQAFANAMAEKLSVKLDDMRTSIAQNMFNQEVVTEEIEFTIEQWEAMSPEEQAEYEIVEGYGKGEYNTNVGKSAKNFHGAVKQYMQNYGNTDSTYDASKAQQAAAKKRMVKAKKVIKKSGGDMTKVNDRADSYMHKTNDY